MVGMMSIQVINRGHVVHVNVVRWGQNGPYPVHLFEIDLIPREGESELQLLQRVGRSVYAEAGYRAITR